MFKWIKALLFKCSKIFKKCGFLSLNHKDLHFQNSQDLFSEYSDTNEIEKRKSAHLKEAYDFFLLVSMLFAAQLKLFALFALYMRGN